MIMQEQNVQDLWREGRENDEVKWEKLRLRIKEEEDALHRRGWFGANFFNWSDRRCVADGGEAWTSLNEPLTLQQPHIPLDTNTPEVATVGTSMPVAQLEVHPEGIHFTSSRSERPTVYDIRARPDFFESISKSKDFRMVKIGVRVLTRQGQNFNKRVLASIIHEVLTAVVAEYNAGQLLAHREALGNEIKRLLIDRAMNMKISLDDVSITTLSLLSEEENSEKAEQDSSSGIIRAQQGDNNWNKLQTYLTLALVIGLTILLSVQSLMPSEYLCYIIGVFATVWIFGPIALLCGLFGTYRYEKSFSRHVGRFTFLCFSIFVLYVFFLISKPIELPTSSLNPPSPSAPLVVTIDSRALFFLALGLIVLAGHIYSWVMGCRTGSDI